MITIDLDSAEPLFNQLVKQIKQAIENKQLKPNDPVPSIRQLASDLDINAKTVAKAYKLLERDSVIESKGYRGSFVHKDAMKNLQIDITEWLNQALTVDIEKYRRAGVTDSEIRIAFTAILSNNALATTLVKE
jgi:GntR family transcriptional regulator